MRTKKPERPNVGPRVRGRHTPHTDQRAANRHSPAVAMILVSQSTAPGVARQAGPHSANVLGRFVGTAHGDVVALGDHRRRGASHAGLLDRPRLLGQDAIGVGTQRRNGVDPCICSEIAQRRASRTCSKDYVDLCRCILRGSECCADHQRHPQSRRGLASTDDERNLEYAHFTDSHCGSCICRNPCDGFRESHMSRRCGHS